MSIFYSWQVMENPLSGNVLSGNSPIVLEKAALLAEHPAARSIPQQKFAKNI